MGKRGSLKGVNTASSRRFQIKKRILQLAKKDQRLRSDGRIPRSASKSIKKIVQMAGWPAIFRFGKEISSAAWLLVLHAGDDIKFQRTCLNSMKRIQNNMLTKKQLAYLDDRVRVHSGQHQLYGTQFYLDKKSDMLLPHPIQNQKSLNARRRSAGLPSFEKYRKDLSQRYKQEKN